MMRGFERSVTQPVAAARPSRTMQRSHSSTMTGQGQSHASGRGGPAAVPTRSGSSARLGATTTLAPSGSSGGGVPTGRIELLMWLEERCEAETAAADTTSRALYQAGSSGSQNNGARCERVPTTAEGLRDGVAYLTVMGYLLRGSPALHTALSQPTSSSCCWSAYRDLRRRAEPIPQIYTTISHPHDGHHHADPYGSLDDGLGGAGPRWAVVSPQHDSIQTVEACERNLMLLQEVLKRCLPRRFALAVDVRRLAKGALQDHMQLLRWLAQLERKVFEGEGAAEGLIAAQLGGGGGGSSAAAPAPVSRGPAPAAAGRAAVARADPNHPPPPVRAAVDRADPNRPPPPVPSAQRTKASMAPPNAAAGRGGRNTTSGGGREDDANLVEPAVVEQLVALDAEVTAMEAAVVNYCSASPPASEGDDADSNQGNENEDSMHNASSILHHKRNNYDALVNFELVQERQLQRDTLAAALGAIAEALAAAQQRHSAQQTQQQHHSKTMPCCPLYAELAKICRPDR